MDVGAVDDDLVVSLKRGERLADRLECDRSCSLVKRERNIFCRS
jgi:hypothetical protein